jgi:acyl-CoA synthetase (AMP-forming)/AMP-acid ligase II
VLEAYAMTEAAHQISSNPLPPRQRKPGTVGVPQGVELRILDDNGDEVGPGRQGEVCIKGDNVTRGYLNNSAANASSYTATGWFRTGDQGSLDEDGYLTITGRLKELINKAGEKISPVEMDNLLARHPAVAEAVSFAVDDDMYGQDIGVAVVLKRGKRLTEEDLRLWVAGRAVKYKIPKRVSWLASYGCRSVMLT